MSGFAGVLSQQEASDSMPLEVQGDPTGHTLEEVDRDRDSSQANDSLALDNRSLPSETAVQERLQHESRKLKQSVRARQASRSAHKSGGKKSRQKSSAVEM